MKNKYLKAIRAACMLCSLLILSPSILAQTRDFCRMVNPFIGTGGHGHTFPGAAMPFGMVQLSPDTRMEGWDACGGYYYTDSVLYGFTHTHLSGTGIADYGDILMMPTTGAYQWDQQDYRSGFNHAHETAAPGYYQVLLDKYGINVRLTATLRAGMQEYTYPKGADRGNVLVDLRHGLGDHVLHSWIRIVNDSTVLGLRESSGWARDQILYFALKFSRPFEKVALALDEKATGQDDSLSGKDVKAFFSFDTRTSKVVLAKVGISAVSPENALHNLDTEMPDFGFERLRREAYNTWNRQLGKIDVSGGTAAQRTLFYTALYHTFLSPNIYQDVDGRFRGTDLKIHQAKGFTNYTVFSLWDTYRAFNPLMTILQPERTADWINTFLAQYKYGGMTPVWELSGNETYCMIGHHSVPVITDAYQKGIRGFDAVLALASMENYEQSDRFALPAYREKGFLSQEDIRESASRTLEYSYDDWCIAQMAHMLGKPADYRLYITRAQNYKNLYDPSSGFFRGKHDGIWHTPFDPREVNGFYTEANAWQYNFAAQQDVSGMIALAGGKKAFADKLNEFFTTSSTLTGNVPPDIAGMIGQYAHGDEPSHHISYLFDYLGMPWRTQELVHQICTTLYHADPNGESGNDDCGQMSAWLVMSAMGFYQVCPGRPEYALGTPMFPEIRIHLPHGKEFTLRAPGVSDTSFYIQSATLDGAPYTKSYLTHTQITGGATIILHMGSTPSKTFGALAADCPQSAITGNQVVPVPYILPIQDSTAAGLLISLGDVLKTAVIRYTTDGSNPSRSATLYKGAFRVKPDAVLKITASAPGMTASGIVTADLTKRNDVRRRRH